MVATLAGLGALILGLGLLMLPLLATELSRPGDSAWGALVLVLALVLVTCADRLTGSPMLAVISGGLLIGRLTVEVGNGRWRQLSPEEQQRLGSVERWSTALAQLGQAGLGLVGQTGAVAGGLGGWLAQHRPGARRSTTKRWVRPALEPAAVPLAVAVSADGTPAEQVAAEPVLAKAVSAELVSAEPVAAVVAPPVTITAAAGAEVVDVSPGPGGSRGDGAG